MKNKKINKNKDNIVLFITSVKEFIIGKKIKENEKNIDLYYPVFIFPNENIQENDSYLSLVPLISLCKKDTITFSKHNILSITEPNDHIKTLYYNMIMNLKEPTIKKNTTVPTENFVNMKNELIN